MKPLLIAVIVMLVLVVGCTSPYQERKEMLLKAYQSGQLTAEQYFSLSNQMEAQRSAALGALGQSLVWQGQSNMWRNTYRDVNRQPQTIFIVP